MEKEKHLLPIQYTEEGGWQLAPKELDDHLRAHFSELRQYALQGRNISNKRVTIVVAIVFGIAAAICALAAFGSAFWAFALGIISLLEIKPLLAFAEREAEIKEIKAIPTWDDFKKTE